MNNSKKDFYIALGAIISKARKEKGYNQDWVANMTGLSRTSVVNIEKGRAGTSLFIYLKLQALLQFEFPSLELYDAETYHQMYMNDRQEELRREQERQEIDMQIEELKEKKRQLKKP